jgi:ferrous iron transport protein A
VISEKRVKLGTLKPGAKGLIAQVGTESISSQLVKRLMEMGVLEGSPFQVVHEAPWGGDPIAVRVRGALIALRRNEANAVEVFIYE